MITPSQPGAWSYWAQSMLRLARPNTQVHLSPGLGDEVNKLSYNSRMPVYNHFNI